ncbi:cell wall-active antibiotics response protein LiaF [Paenibacillus sp. MBLB4367]|uniref:cell wall-active antibiotics response protein LiaF n=1 Tax=Paenibacillus sp. MBLB4367 TaxID=3384767 RepID=UPI00390828B1
MNESKRYNKRNTYMVLIGAGVFLLVNKAFGFYIVAALCLMLLGLHSIITASGKKGYILLAVGAIIILGNNFPLVLAIILLSFAFFYLRSKKLQPDESYVQKHKLMESMKWDKAPWVLKNMSVWNVIGEVNMDLSLAIPEQKESVVVLQGIIGDIDILVPEDMGVSVQCSLMFGQVDVAREKEAGLLNKIVWQSPNYEASEQKVKLIVSYIVGDVDIKVM